MNGEKEKKCPVQRTKQKGKTAKRVKTKQWDHLVDLNRAGSYIHVVMGVITNSFSTFMAACVFMPVQCEKNVFIRHSS